MTETVSVAKDELDRLRRIEAAAVSWRRSLEGDEWSKNMIENDPGICRPGIGDLFRLVS